MLRGTVQGRQTKEEDVEKHATLQDENVSRNDKESSHKEGSKKSEKNIKHEVDEAQGD
jgi:hypothetical protein